MRRPLYTFTVGIAAIFAAGCGSPQEPLPEVAAALESARIPAEVTPGTDFRLVAYFVHGLCDVPHPVVELTSTEATLGLRLRQLPIPPGSACPDLALEDSVVALVAAPVTLPYTVRLQRAQHPDSVVIVRAEEPAG